MHTFLIAAGLLAQLADPLPRRGYFGVGLEKAEGGARVFSVAPNSTAAAAGIAIGDVIESVDELTITTPESAVAAIGKHKSGDSVALIIRGGDDRRAIRPTLKAFPQEQVANSTMQYGSVLAAGARLRTIVSIPTAQRAKHPAVLLVQGGGCGSIDTPFSPAFGQTGIMHGIGSQGFVTMRVEKSGMGDSQGAPCDTIGYHEELAGYQAAFKALRDHPSVDRDRIYLLGLSLGGVFSPILAAETHVAGIVVYGTGSTAPPVYPGRSARFFKEFAKIDVPAAWRKVGTRVRVLRGEYDEQGEYVNRAAHEAIVTYVGASATFTELAGLDHGGMKHASLAASRENVGRGEEVPTLLNEILVFLRQPGQ